jgi:hypothetical protein
MGALKLTTASSGSVILNPANTASDVTITVPAVTGTMLTTKTAGSVLQVVQATYSTLTSIASTSFTDTGLSASITPTSSSNKILVIVTQPVNFGRASTAINGYYQLLRGSSSVFNGGRSFGLFVNTAGDMDNSQVLSVAYLDSPATTSSTTYKTQAKLSTTANSASAAFQNDSAVASMILMEISA